MIWYKGLLIENNFTKWDSSDEPEIKNTLKETPNE